MEKRCELYTDHKSLKFIFTQPTFALGNEESWSLSRFTILEINYHPEKGNVVVDAWSQRSHLSQVEVDIIDHSSCASSSISSALELLLI
jgi:hypothetical protein